MAADERPRIPARYRAPKEYDPEREIYGEVPYGTDPFDTLIEDSRKSGVWEVDAWLYEGLFRNVRGQTQLSRHRVRHYPNRAALTEAVKLMESRRRAGSTWTAPLREGGVDYFAGVGGWMAGYTDAPVIGQYIPLIPGPQSRQMYWRDYFRMNAQAFEAWNYNPVAHRVIDAMVDFVIGRGVRWSFEDPDDQATWEAWWRRNRMDQRFEDMVGDFFLYGELFNRWMPASGNGAARGPNTIIRSIDPATIYEIVGNNEDVEDVYFYHQQFAPRIIQIDGQQGPMYYIRHLPADEVDHYKINTRTGEARGRSVLLPVLGWLKRLKDLLTSEVIRADMAARIGLHVQIDGDDQEIQDVIGRMFPSGRMPDPGAVIGTNQQTIITQLGMMGAGAGAGRSMTGVGGANDALLTMISLGTGIPPRYLGVETTGTRADAIVATEPGAKKFERYRGILDRVLQDMVCRVLDKDPTEDLGVEFVWPSLVTDDRSQTLKDLQLASGEEWLSHRTVAEIAAKEFGHDTYEYDEEQAQIDEERERRAEIRKAMQDDIAAGSALVDPPDGTTPAAPGSGPDNNADGASRGGLPSDQNPLATDSGVRKAVTESTPGLEDIIREAARQAAREARRPRKHPDDPEFRAAEDAYRTATRENVDELLKSSED
jgi:hypothetical protein